jgi:ABC-type Fe3+-hydroxamate transport system substrate-binding protein
MPTYRDQTGKNITLPGIPSRIISLVPSQTELLFDLGLGDAVTGITKFCVHPQQWFRNKIRIGGTKALHVEQIKALQPDLIIANKEENIKEQVDALAANYPVWVSDISNLLQALEMIGAIGEITAMAEKAQTIIAAIKKGFDHLPEIASPIRTAYLIWQDPFMTIGSDTFIHDMLAHGGFENIFADRQRYPSITIEEIKNRNCDLLLLSSEPFPFKQKHIAAFQKKLPSTKILLADGEMFSWYGSRLLLAPGYFTLLRKMSDV